MRRRTGMRIAAPLLAGALALAGCGDDDGDVADASGERDAVSPASPDGELAFASLDANGDTYLDADEVAEWVDDEGVFRKWDSDADSELDEDEIAGNAFEVWDDDDDGTISEAEWEEAAREWYDDADGVTVYSDADGDGDSAIDADEFAEWFDFSALGESWTQAPLDQRSFAHGYFELYDDDGDGKVTESEWEHGVAVFGTPEEL